MQEAFMKSMMIRGVLENVKYVRIPDLTQLPIGLGLDCVHQCCSFCDP